MRKVTLYIIDDEEEVVTTLKQLFKANKRFRVRAHTSVAGLQADVEQNPPHIVLCDYLMPECDGLDLLRELKARFPAMRGILLTGQAFDQQIVRGLEQGLVSQYIAKPWDQRQLEETVLRLAREVAKELPPGS